jgi:type II secretory pathway pseudopilin PulG
MTAQKHAHTAQGFSMLELTLVIALILIVTAVLFMTLDPGGLSADARNRKRESDANALIGLIYRNITDNGGVFTCATGALPASSTNIADNNPAAGDYDIANCLIPQYTSALPYDPRASGAHFSGVGDYDLGYRVMISSSTNRVTISAPNAERGAVIQVTR